MSSAARPYRGVAATDRRARRREQLIEAALSLVLERGVDAVTAEAVSERAGLTKRYFYESFRDRDVLLVRLLDDLLDAVRSAVTSGLADADGPTERVDATVAALVDTLVADPARARLYAEAALRKALDDRRRSAQGEFADLVLEAVLRAGPERRLDALFVVAGATDVVTRWLLGELDLDRDDLVAALAQLGRSIV